MPLKKKRIALDPPFLDKEEEALIRSFDLDLADKVPASEFERRKKEWRMAARNTMNPPKVQISARLSKYDLSRLKTIAMEKGIPYQTLLGSIVHQYVEGRLKETS
jgi:predicted DNA binding CopG/RHH family protein